MTARDLSGIPDCGFPDYIFLINLVIYTKLLADPWMVGKSRLYFTIPAMSRIKFIHISRVKQTYQDWH